jgi:DNA repair exonuclease SbcCD nuclease subunit
MAFRLLHCADLHHGNDEDLLRDTTKCAEFMVAQARERRPDLIAIAGDIWDRAVVLGSPATIAAIRLVQQMGAIAPVVIASGTLTHDAPGSTRVFNELRTTYHVYAADTPQQIALTPSGFVPLAPDVSMTTLKECSAVISLLPTVTKAGILAVSDLSVNEGNEEIAELLRDLLQAWGILNETANSFSIPTVLVGHCNVTGSSLSTGQKLVGREIEVGITDLRLARARVNCLGHIHKAQQLGSNTFFSGSLTRQDHAETEDKGFYVHRIDGDRLESEFVKTPARKMVTLKADGLPDTSLLDTIEEGDFVRIVYTVKEEERHRVDDAALVRIAKEKGAAEVKIDKETIPLATTRGEGISRLRSLPEKFGKWAELNGVAVTEGLLSKLEMLQTRDAAGILEGYFGKEEADEGQLFAA